MLHQMPSFPSHSVVRYEVKHDAFFKHPLLFFLFYLPSALSFVRCHVPFFFSKKHAQPLVITLLDSLKIKHSFQRNNEGCLEIEPADTRAYLMRRVRSKFSHTVFVGICVAQYFLGLKLLRLRFSTRSCARFSLLFYKQFVPRSPPPPSR